MIATLGIVLILLVAIDLARTALSPSARGPLNHAIYRTTWRIAASVPRPARRRALPVAGPASIILTIVAWLVLLWVGFACLYLPLIAEVDGPGGAALGSAGMRSALYLSGTTLTTLGFGDLVPAGWVPRFLSIAEAASGLGVFTAAISYLPSIYTAVTDLRASARMVGDLGAEQASVAAVMVVHGGHGAIESVRSEVVATREHLARFPVLHYFQPPADESRLALVGGAVAVCVTARWCIDPVRFAHVEPWAVALERGLRQLLLDTVPHVRRVAIDEAALPAKVVAARAAVDAAGPGDARRGPVPAEALTLLVLAEEVLQGYAAMHEQERRPLLAGGVSPPAAGRSRGT